MPISDPRDRFFYPHHTHMKDTYYLKLLISKLNFMGSENLLWDVSSWSLRWASTSRYLTLHFNSSYLKLHVLTSQVSFLVPENLIWDISILRFTSTLRCLESTVLVSVFQIRHQAVARLRSLVGISTRIMWGSSRAQGNAAISPHNTEHLLYTSGIW